MKILQTIKTKWTLVKETETATGVSRLLSGYNRVGRFYHDKAPAPGFTWEEHPNIVFEAQIKTSRASRGRSSALVEFTDSDGLHTYQTGLSGLFEILRGLEAGNITIQNGWLTGTFTFQKQGQEIYLMPYVHA